MKSRSLRPRSLAVAVAALVAASGLSADRSFAGSPVYTDDSGKASPNTVVGPSNVQGAPARYIVRFVEQPLAMYNSSVSSKPVNGIGAIPSKAGKNGRLRLDVTSSQAIAYVQYLKDQQHQHLSAINSAIGQSLTPRYSMQHALNAVVVVLTPQEAAKVAKVPGVLAVNRDVPHPLATDIGPGFIGAASVWWGSPAGQDTIFANGFESTPGFLGDGIVIGDIDTGYNSSSPSFQATDAHGYTIQNPLGTGNFLGQCGVAGISDAGCNDKVIGVYDEIELTSSGPPFSVEDTQGHGSHTASTAGGNFRSATFSGYVANISGVAPHANLIIYYACSPDPTVQCSTAATSASVDQAIQDGVVDALNYSISGGSDPWNDPTSQAFLSATDAGIFVAAAAGNTSASVPLPLPGTANHAEPWVATVAASTHTGGSIAPTLTVTGPGTVPANLVNIPLTAGSGGVAATATFTGPIVLSPQFHNSDLTGTDGCAGYPAGTFTGAAALVSRGTCSFSIKVNAATAAGAVAVIISDNRVEGPLTPSVPGTTVPAYTVLQSQGTDLQTFLAANSNTGAAVIPYPPSRLPQQPDELANFSLLGPVAIDVIKPDVEAPGVNILAAIANDGTAGGPDLVALYNGTSMATPHTTGSAGLMFGVHPEWSPSEAKSALMMTAKEAGLTKPNGTTPADFFDRGSGRLQDFVATKAGLVLNETGLNFALADPGLGGDPSTLNIASLSAHACLSPGSASCGFQRKFHSTQDHAVTWTATVGGDVALVVSVSPASFSVVPHGTRLVDFDVDASATNADGAFHFAEVVLTPDDATLPALHLPVAVRVPAPSISASPSPLNIAITSGTTGSGTLTVNNDGGPTLNVTNTNDTTTANAKFVVIDQPSQGNNGYYSTNFTDQGPNGSYASDDFVVPVSGANISRIFVPGFSTGNALSTLTGHGVHFRIYGNAGGLPNGDPQGLTSATPAVYSYDTTIGATGLSVAGNNINLDLVAAGAPATNLAAGTYWLVAYVDMSFGTDLGGFAQFVTTAGQGNTGAEFGPVFGETAWAAITDAPGFAMHIEQQVPCGAPWLSATPSTLTIGPASSAPLTVNVDGTLFPGATGSAQAFLCLDSNDPATPVLAVPVRATGGPVGPQLPTVTKAFAPSSVSTGANSTATITLANANASAATLTANLVDTLPVNLVATAGTAATTCVGGAGASIAAGGGSVTLGSGAAIPANGSCTVSFTVTSATAATYTNTIPVGGLQTSAGNNAVAGSANLTVTAAACVPAQPLQDPGFEATAGDLSGNPFWTSTSTNFGNAFCNAGVCGNGGGTANFHAGAVWVWLGGAGTAAETATASQAVVIPSGSPRFLNFYLWIGSVSAGIAANMDVKIDGTTVHSYPAPATAEAGYTVRSIDVSAFANGASHTILFTYNTPAGGNSNYSLDDVTLDCAAPPAETPRPATNPPTGPTTRLVH